MIFLKICSYSGEEEWVFMELVEIDPFKRISLKLPPRFGGGMRLRICCMVQAPFRSKRDRIPTRIPGHFGIVIVGVVICHLLVSSQRFSGGLHILVFYLFFLHCDWFQSSTKIWSIVVLLHNPTRFWCSQEISNLGK